MDPESLRRRELLAALAGLLYVASGCGGSDRAPVPPPVPEGFVRAARVDDLGEAWRRRYVPFADRARWVYLRLEARDDRRAADVVALSERCTHLGCPVRYVPSSRRFICPCHGAVFSDRGKPLGGPAKLPLIRLERRIVGGDVYVAPWGTVEGRRGFTSA